MGLGRVSRSGASVLVPVLPGTDVISVGTASQAGLASPIGGSCDAVADDGHISHKNQYFLSGSLAVYQDDTTVMLGWRIYNRDICS